MPAVITPIITALGGAFGSAFTTTGISTTLTSTAVFGAFKKIALGVALSALSRAIMPDENPASRGVRGTRIKADVGEDNPYNFIMGKYGTPGEILYHGSWGGEGDMDNEHYVQVFELSNMPSKVTRIWINGEWVTLKQNLTSQGYPVEGYMKDDHDRLFVKILDGTQTTADPYLLEVFGNHPEHPWTEDMIGRGLTLAIVTAGLRGDIHRQRPECFFELETSWYDPRKDRSNGGSGAQRYNDFSTWKPTVNNAVLSYNIMRGIRDPITNDFIWGGQDISKEDLPNNYWFTLMNECDEDENSAEGPEPRYRAGYEVRVDEEPASVLEEFFKGMQGIISEIGDQWVSKTGVPAAAVYSFTDQDLIVTSPDSFDPFPGIDVSYNGVNSKYPEPEFGYRMRDSRSILNSQYLAEDLGNVNNASLNFPTVPYRRQVVRLMRSGLRDQRRFRRHTVILPPEARYLTPIDTVIWSSDRNLYTTKLFYVDLVEDLKNGCIAISLREHNPDDYDDTDDLIDPPVVKPRRPTVRPQLSNFTVEPATIKDNQGRDRRVAIRLNWIVKPNITGVRYQVRLADTKEHVPGNSRSNSPVASERSSGIMALAGEQASLAGEAATYYSVIDDPSAGTALISQGIHPQQDYEVRAIYEPITNREWCQWMPVTTGNVKIKRIDLDDDEIVDVIDDAKEKSEVAADNAADALIKANEAQSAVEGLNEEVLEDLNFLVQELQGLEAGGVAKIRGIAVAGAKGGGWVRDPIFDDWTGTNLTNWTTSGITDYGTEVEGQFPSALYVNFPGGPGTITIKAETSQPHQIKEFDLEAEYVVVSVLIRCLSGDINQSRIRPEWQQTPGGPFIRGHAFGVNNCFGNFDTDWGFVIDSNRLQSAEIIWKKPFSGAANAFSLSGFLKIDSLTTAIELRLDYLNVRKATKQEIEAFESKGYADAQISEFSATIIGPGGAIALQVDELRVEFGDSIGLIQDDLVTLVNDVEVLSGRIEITQSQFSGANLVRNSTFEDGVRPAGELPEGWTSWNSGVSVVQRSGSTAPISTAPSKFMAQFSSDTTQREVIPHGLVPVKPNNEINVGIIAAAVGTGTINTSLQVRVRWFAPDRVTQLSVNSQTLVLVNNLWTQDSFSTVTSPAGVGYYDVVIRRPGNQSAHSVVFTKAESYIVDEVSLARVNEAVVAASNAEQSIASWNLNINAEFGDFDSFINIVAAASADSEKANSAFVIRQFGAEFAIVSWQNENNVGAAIKLIADNVIIPGTLSTSLLSISELGYNLVPDNQLQSPLAWSGSSDGFSIIKDTSHGTAKSQGELRWTHSSGSGEVSSFGTEFPVFPGDKLVMSAEYDRLGTGRIVGNIGLRYLNKQGTFQSSQTFHTFDTTSGALGR
jgi:hypothetical protein